MHVAVVYSNSGHHDHTETVKVFTEESGVAASKKAVRWVLKRGMDEGCCIHTGELTYVVELHVEPFQKKADETFGEILAKALFR